MDLKDRIMLASIAVSVAIVIGFVGSIAIDDSDADDAVVAKIGDEGYTSLEAAWNAALDANKDTIIDLIADSSGNGLQIADGSGFDRTIILNLNNHTYTFTGGAVGSTGTTNQALHLNGAEGSAVLFYGGTNKSEGTGKLTVSSSATDIKLFCMNYINLTFKDVTIDLKDATQITRGITSCEDILMITGNTQVLMGQDRDAIVNDMFGSHGDSYITFDNTFTGTIDGDICVWVEKDAKGERGNIGIQSGTFLGTIGKLYPESEDASRIEINVTGGSFTDIFDAVEYAKTEFRKDHTYLKLASDIGTKENPSDRSITVDEGQRITLDFNGKWIYSNAKKTINNMGTLIIEDTAETHGGIVNDQSEYTIIKNFGQGLLVISDICVSSDDTAEGGTRIAVKQDDFDREGGDVVADEYRGRTIIYSGTFTAGQAVQAWGVVEINGGTFNGQITAITQAFTRDSENINDAAGTITVNGGTFNSNFVCVSMESWTDEEGESPTITIYADKIKIGDSVGTIDIRIGYAKGSTNGFIEQKDYPEKSGSIPRVIIIGTLPKNMDLNASVTVTSSADKGEVTIYLAYFEDVVKAVNTLDLKGPVTITLLRDISAILSDDDEDIFAFKNTGLDLTIDGNDKMIKCVPRSSDTKELKPANIIVFDTNVTAKIGNLIVDGNGIALSGISINDSANISVNDILIKDILAECIIANSCTLEVDNCDLDWYGAVGGIYIYSEDGKEANLKVDGIFNGTILTNTSQSVTVTYPDAEAKITSAIGSGMQTGDWTWWFSSGDDDVAAQVNSFLVDGDVTVTGDVVLKEQTISISVGKTVTLTEGSTLTGTITGPLEKSDDNKLIANGLKAGDGSITFTGGSLIISGRIASAGSTVAGTTVTLSGDAIKIEGALDEGATMEIGSGTVVTIESGTAFESKGTITNNGTITNTGTLTNSGTLKMVGSSSVTGTVVNKAVIADERKTGEAVKIDDSTSTGVVVTKDNASAYEGTGTKVIIEDPESQATEGTITVDTNIYAFVNALTTTGKLNIIMNDGARQYTVTIPKGTTIGPSTIISIGYVSHTSNTTDYDIKMPDIGEFSVKVPVQTGFDNAKVLYEGSEQGISNVRYNSTTGYVTFDAGCSSVFTIVLSYVAPTASDTINANVAFIGATILLVISILALAAVIMRR